MHKRFDTEILIRPDDIDMNNHVHMSKYLDYVLFARYDQMSRCYRMSMDEFITRGWGWVVKSCSIEYKRPLSLGEAIIVRTWLEHVEHSDVRVGFRILKKETSKISAEGHFLYTMVNLQSGRAEEIPEWVVKQYTQYRE